MNAACGKNLTMETRIRCMECTTETDFCLSCFCAGKEPGPHSKHHKYQVLSNLHFPLFNNKWSAEEEMLLLEGANCCLPAQACALCVVFVVVGIDVRGHYQG